MPEQPPADVEQVEESSEGTFQFSSRTLFVIAGVVAVAAAGVHYAMQHQSAMNRRRAEVTDAGVFVAAAGGRIGEHELTYPINVEKPITADRLLELIEKYPELFENSTDVRIDDGSSLTREHFAALAEMDDLEVIEIYKGENVQLSDITPLSKAPSLKSLYIKGAPFSLAEAREVLPASVLYSNKYYASGGLQEWERHTGMSIEEYERRRVAENQ